MKLAAVLTQQDGAILKQVKLCDYLFKSTVDQAKLGELFTFNDIAILADATFKQQMQMQTNYPDYIVEKMSERNELVLDKLTNQKVNSVLMFFRGFLSMDS